MYKSPYCLDGPLSGRVLGLGFLRIAGVQYVIAPDYDNEHLSSMFYNGQPVNPPKCLYICDGKNYVYQREIR